MHKIQEQKIRQNEYFKYSMNEWRNLLASQVDVYVYGNSYLGKKFDNIQYQFLNVNEAKEVLRDNLYYLLRYHYFYILDDEVDKVINKVVSNFIENIKTTLQKVEFQSTDDDGVKKLNTIPEYCIAFRNGVYDFKNNKWLFKIEKKYLENLHNCYYEYNRSYIILWYLNIDFEELDIDITNISVEDLNNVLKEINEATPLYTYALVHNMSFDTEDKLNFNKFKHLCEILGYVINNKFIQSFVFFSGSGGNGKNSLFDGAFTSKLIPKPASLSLHYIEENEWVTGSLLNTFHNIYLESPPKSFTKADVIKQLTGSTQQSIKKKGKDAYTGYMDVKFVFSANDKESLKFSDATPGFIRRLNLFEVFYKWDANGNYLREGDYIRVDLSPDLKEITDNKINTILFCYLAMWGMNEATKNFTKPFKFTYNDYGISYSEYNEKLYKQMRDFTLEDFMRLITIAGDDTIYIDGKRIYMHPEFKEYFCIVNNWKEIVNDKENLREFLDEKHICIRAKEVKDFFNFRGTTNQFNKEIKQINKKEFKKYRRENYIEIITIGEKFKW